VAENLRAILGVSAPRDDVVAVQLTRPAPYFPQLLTRYSAFPVFSESAARPYCSRTWVSNGAYVLSSWTPGGTLQLLKNPFYWDRDHVGIASVIARKKLAAINSCVRRGCQLHRGNWDALTRGPLRSLRFAGHRSVSIQSHWCGRIGRETSVWIPAVLLPRGR
jgi:ABC-type transport system substrate-binding protein